MGSKALENMIQVVHPVFRIPDPDADFLPILNTGSQIPDPGVEKAPDPGSRIPDPDPQHWLLLSSLLVIPFLLLLTFIACVFAYCSEL